METKIVKEGQLEEAFDDSLSIVARDEEVLDSDETLEHFRDVSIYDVFATVDEGYRAGMPLLTESEREQLATWNMTQRDYSQDACVQQLVAMQAAATPHAVALVSGNQVLHYGELNSRANQLAHYLQTLGVGPNVLVALCLERSLDMVIGLLGILKAGALTYLSILTIRPSALLSCWRTLIHQHW